MSTMRESKREKQKRERRAATLVPEPVYRMKQVLGPKPTVIIPEPEKPKVAKKKKKKKKKKAKKNG